MEMKFKDVVNNIKEGEIWKNKSEGRRLKSIQCCNDIIMFNLDDKHKDFAVHKNDEFVLERKEFDVGFAIQELKKGKTIESVYDNNVFKMEDDEIYILLGNDMWRKLEYPFSNEQILHNWYIEN